MNAVQFGRSFASGARPELLAALPPSAPSPRPVHGDVREDGRRFDATLPYGGGWLPSAEWVVRNGQAATPLLPEPRVALPPRPSPFRYIVRLAAAGEAETNDLAVAETLVQTLGGSIVDRFGKYS